MRFLGGKSKIAKRLAATIGGGNTLIEPFCGGGAMTAALAPSFHKVWASDIHPDLIMMWQALQAGWMPPANISHELYVQLRESTPSALRGFAGFSSWGGKWFGGYPRGGQRNYADEVKRSLERDIQLMKNVTFLNLDYRLMTPKSGDVVYADPPYTDTTQYTEPFDNYEFWDIMNQWVSIGAIVFVSEYRAPSDWPCILEIEKARDMRSKLTNTVLVKERLFRKN